MNGEQRAKRRKSLGIKDEWFLRKTSGERLRICSHTHDDDVELEISGNFLSEQRLKVAMEICEQLNEAERKFDEPDV